METLYRLARQCDEAADALATAARRVTRLDPPATAFGVETRGRLAGIGGALREQWLLATGARQQEAASAAAQLTDLAAAVRVAANGYAETDAAAGYAETDVANGYAGTDAPAGHRRARQP